MKTLLYTYGIMNFATLIVYVIGKSVAVYGDWRIWKIMHALLPKLMSDGQNVDDGGIG